jgi:hypothetical protein
MLLKCSKQPSEYESTYKLIVVMFMLHPVDDIDDTYLHLLPCFRKFLYARRQSVLHLIN